LIVFSLTAFHVPCAIYVPDTVRKFERRRVLDLKVTNSKGREIDCYEGQTIFADSQMFSSIFFIRMRHFQKSEHFGIPSSCRNGLPLLCARTPDSSLGGIKNRYQNCKGNTAAYRFVPPQEIMRISTDDAIEVPPPFPPSSAPPTSF
jgi:hypothetical protein